MQTKQKKSNLTSLPSNFPFTRRYPAEWESQRCTWLSWPHNENEWGKDRIGGEGDGGIRGFFEELIKIILDF